MKDSESSAAPDAKYTADRLKKNDCHSRLAEADLAICPPVDSKVDSVTLIQPNCVSAEVARSECQLRNSSAPRCYMPVGEGCGLIGHWPRASVCLARLGAIGCFCRGQVRMPFP